MKKSLYDMSASKKNIFLTGAPSSGKTTIIKKVIGNLASPVNGFYTEEEKQNDKRVGFLMTTLDGESGYLARRDIESAFYIRRYGVSIENIEKIAVPSIVPVKTGIIILDEIGKMECFSELFRTAVIFALNSPNIVVGTITLGGGEFIEKIKARQDMAIYEVTRENRDSLPEVILQEVRGLIEVQKTKFNG